jgi:trigger factor
MRVTQEKRPGSRIGLTIVVEADQVKKSYEKTLRDLTQQVQVQGFRKGKAPRNLVVRQVGKQRVTASAIDELINGVLPKALEEIETKPLTQFELDSKLEELFANFSTDQEFTFSGWVEVYPEVEVSEYKGLTVSPTRVFPDPEQVDNTINRWREQRATLLPVEDRPAVLGDVAVIDYEGFDTEGNPLEGTSGEAFQLELQEDQFLPGFVAGIVGMSLDETKEIESQFPDDYMQESLAGAAVTFKVTLIDLKTKELPDLDDEFVQSISNNDFSTVDELKQHLQTRYEQEAQVQSENNLEEAILDALVADVEIDLPGSLINQETYHLIVKSLSSLRDQGLNVNNIAQFLNQLPPETLQSLRERFQPDAEKRLCRTLALGQVVKQESIAVGRTELEVAVEDVLHSYGEEAKNIDLKRLRESVHEELLTRKVLSWLKSQTTAHWVDEEGNPVDPPTSTSEESEIPAADFSESDPTPEESTSDTAEVSAESATVAVAATEVMEAEIQAEQEQEAAEELAPETEEAESVEEGEPE